ncbi:hypothetical protein LWC08_14105 [Desulfobaculum bizertense]|uniref:hypothetical protein n=1 Tax=Desulfobaculum bizertense TaxID=376490 RepID=UPI001F23A37C|nr:hypothetical protein [Desulfobaculum bizertense]UIJ37807.1 hypothetical protein LWC08_14105 [Desulfobaculum bizertense]
MSMQIMSAALMELGEEGIGSLKEDSELVRIMSVFYETERDAMLEEHPWNFALRRVELAEQVSGAAFGYARAFQLPSDALCVVDVEPEQNFELEGQSLLTDSPHVFLRYVRRIRHAKALPPTFRSALAARLAARVAKKITGSSAEKERMEVLYRERLRTAKSRDAQGGGRPAPQRPHAFISARES